MGTALIIDPVLEIVQCDLQLLGGLGLKLRYVIRTHEHIVHTGGPARPLFGEAVAAAAIPGAAEKNPRGME
jgi:glyoxylase-like metal-dependent hydrolase (beta-lactamase superfamily II)